MLFLHIMGMSSFLPDVDKWTSSREHGLLTAFKEFVLCTTVFKTSCEEFCTYIGGSRPDKNWISWKIGLCLELAYNFSSVIFLFVLCYICARKLKYVHCLMVDKWCCLDLLWINCNPMWKCCMEGNYVCSNYECWGQYRILTKCVRSYNPFHWTDRQEYQTNEFGLSNVVFFL